MLYCDTEAGAERWYKAQVRHVITLTMDDRIKNKMFKGPQLPGGDKGYCRIEHCPLGGHQDKKTLNFQLEVIWAATYSNNIILWYLDVFNSDWVFEKAFSSPPFKYNFGNWSQTSLGDDTSMLLLFSGVWKKWQDIPGLVKENPP